MKKRVRTVFSLLVLSLILSCKNKEALEPESAAEASSVDMEKPSAENNADEQKIVSSSAAVAPENSNKKFVRTADIKFEVNNVAQSTYAIEDATTKLGGYITYTNLQSVISDKNETKVSQDSTLITTKYIMENNMTIRVPNKRLDAVIKAIAKEIDFLDYRIIKADDVTLQMLANDLAQNRSSNTQGRIKHAIDNKGKGLNSIVNAENDLDHRNAEKDSLKIENLSLKDQVNLSTITLQLYQEAAVKQKMIPNEKSINAYRPNIGLQIWDSLKTGWFMLEAIIAFVVQLWGIALIICLSWFGYKKFLKKKQ